MSEVKVNKISPRTNCGTTQLGDAGDTITVTGDLKSNSIKTASGSTLTLGQSGDTVTLASGASQSGFGRTGTVDWQTTKKTAAFTAVNGEGYFVDTTSAAITATLPASPSAGDIVAFKDYANTFDTNRLTLGRNGSNIDGVANDFTVNAEGQSLTLVYIDATRGWAPTDAAKASDFSELASFVAATGGTVTTCGNFKIHTFTGPGTFCVSSAGNPLGSSTVDYMVVAGGGGGSQAGYAGGGGGAGGYRESSGAASGCYSRSPLGACVSALPVTATAYPVTVGGGGPGSPGNCAERRGSNSVFSTITSTGGGSGYPHNNTAPDNNKGGSGGGGGGTNDGNPGRTGGSAAGNTPPVSPPQGNPGGNGHQGGAGNHYGGGGGGGAGGSGSNGSNGSGGNGGGGTPSSISGSATTRAGGGGGSVTGDSFSPGSLPVGSGGSGGGGSGGGPGGNTPAATSGTANTGGGGGGSSSGPGPSNTSGAGGSGIVIVRYKFQ